MYTKYGKGKKHNQLIAIIETMSPLDGKRSHEICGMNELKKFVERCLLLNVECHVLPIPEGQVIYKTEEE